MNPVDQIKLGMSPDEVRQLLKGWTARVADGILSADRLHLFHTWDFVPRSGSPFKALRATFDNGKLLIWGEPASFSQDRRAESA
jgi:hypothetical protein